MSGFNGKYQRTLRRDFSCRGPALHSGELVHLRVRPAPADSGIRFVRSDLGRRALVVGPETVTSTSFATTVSGKGFSISTVEHLMSALVGMGVDNALVEVDGDEIPVMDGSAAPFVRLIESAGMERQLCPRRYMKIIHPVIIREKDKSVALYPYDAFRVECEIEFDHPVIKRQRLEMEITPETFRDEIAAARTFGFLSDWDDLKKRGFANGGSLDNAVVLDGHSVLNEGGLRFPDEFVRHKILDAVGDLFLTGMPILGRLVAYRSGHGLNNRLARRLMAEPDCWRSVEMGRRESREFTAGLPAAALAR